MLVFSVDILGDLISLSAPNMLQATYKSTAFFLKTANHLIQLALLRTFFWSVAFFAVSNENIRTVVLVYYVFFHYICPCIITGFSPGYGLSVSSVHDTAYFPASMCAACGVGLLHGCAGDERIRTNLTYSTI